MPDIMKTMCQLYLFMYLFRFAASSRFFFAWQQTHWLNYYFCLSDASCMLKNQRCSNGKKQKKPTVCHFPFTPILLGGLLPLCFRCFSTSNIMSVCIMYPEVSSTRGRPDPHKHTRAAVAGLRLCLLHPAHIHPTFLIYCEFIYVNLHLSKKICWISTQFRAVKFILCYFLSLQVYIFKMIQCFQRTSRDIDYSWTLE